MSIYIVICFNLYKFPPLRETSRRLSPHRPGSVLTNVITWCFDSACLMDGIRTHPIHRLDCLRLHMCVRIMLINQKGPGTAAAHLNKYCIFNFDFSIDSAVSASTDVFMWLCVCLLTRDFLIFSLCRQLILAKSALCNFIMSWTILLDKRRRIERKIRRRMRRFIVVS